ncbi:MAG TPA: TraI domain-containing protein [Gammaproteobacteria bacterium]|nr:TraI domain-containing protein [Gammaproteobacteria bacterium]
MNKLKKKPLSQKVALQKNATPILSAEDLLSSEKRQQTLSDIRTLLNLPDEEYDKVFLSVIHNFALFVQNLPETERSFYASLGGMIDHALERASLSLFLARTYLLPEGTTLSSVSEEEMLWVYAIFTASLLLDVGKIPTRHVVSLTDANGNVSEAWHPYTGPMQIKGSTTHYVFGFMDEHNDHLRWMVTPLLARQIVGDTGFNWLSSNEEVLQAWLGLLSDDQTEMGWLKVIPLADAQILESYFTDRKVFRHSLSTQTIGLINKIIKERNDAKNKQKELHDRLTGEQIDKAQDKDKKEAKETKEKTGDEKIDKEAALEAAILAQQEKLRGVAREAKEASITPKEEKAVVGNFINWLNQTQEKTKTGESNVEINRVAEGVVITKEIIDRFVSENKLQNLSSELVEKILQQQSFATPWMVANITGQMAPALIAQTSNLVFAPGMAVSLHVQAFPINSNPDVKAVPTETKFAEEVKDKEAHHKTSPTPYLTSAKRS